VTVAVVGGDSRTERMNWPSGYSVRCFQSNRFGGEGELQRLKGQMASGKIGAVVILTRWMGHAAFRTIRDKANCKVITWDRGIGELVKALPALVGYQKV
jgi:hypothetical protein